MKRFLSFGLLMALLLASFAGAEMLPTAHDGAIMGYELIYTDQNPVPAIAKRVRPAVPVLINSTTVWDQNTGAVYSYEISSGSAIYIDERGYFLTCYHVVEESDELTLRFQDGTELEAYIVGVDSATDIAVIKTDDPVPAQPVPIGKSGELQEGELAIAIGNPMGVYRILEGSVSVGVISGLERDDEGFGFTRSVRAIQTDASISSGSSGGALLNRKGELIGVTASKIISMQGNMAENLSFAIPSDLVWAIAQGLIEKGVYLRPRLGMTVVAIDGPETSLTHYPPAGLRIEAVEPSTSAEQAGLQPQDVITHINGQRIYSFVQFTAIFDAFDVADTVTLTIARYYDAEGVLLRKPIVMDVTLELRVID